MSKPEAKTVQELIELVCLRCSGSGHVPKAETVKAILKSKWVSEAYALGLEGENKKLQTELSDYKTLRESLLKQHMINCERLKAIQEWYQKTSDCFDSQCILATENLAPCEGVDCKHFFSLKGLGVLVSQGQDHVVAKLGVLLNPPKGDKK